MMNTILPMNALLPLRRVLEITGRSRSWVYREIAAGRFPAARQVGVRAVAWFESDIAEWMQGLAEATRKPAPKGGPANGKATGGVASHRA